MVSGQRILSLGAPQEVHQVGPRPLGRRNVRQHLQDRVDAILDVSKRDLLQGQQLLDVDLMVSLRRVDLQQAVALLDEADSLLQVLELLLDRLIRDVSPLQPEDIALVEIVEAGKVARLRLRRDIHLLHGKRHLLQLQQAQLVGITGRQEVVASVFVEKVEHQPHSEGGVVWSRLQLFGEILGSRSAHDLGQPGTVGVQLVRVAFLGRFAGQPLEDPGHNAALLVVSDLGKRGLQLSTQKREHLERGVRFREVSKVRLHGVG